jgi:cytochrome c556
MQLLTGALERAVRAIGLGEVRVIAHDLHQVHAAKQATDAAIREGKYRLPKNPERVDRFRELDAAFHGHLEQLVKASNTNDVAGTSAAFASAMHGCQGCHAEFRR